jgi:hypothetical protein
MVCDPGSAGLRKVTGSKDMLTVDVKIDFRKSSAPLNILVGAGEETDAETGGREDAVMGQDE